MRKVKNSDEIKMYEGRIPVMQLDVINEDDGSIEEGVGFLAPFHGYSFQVSKTFEGEYDMGSTAVVGLGHITDMSNSYRTGWQYRSNLDNEGRIQEIIRWGMCAAILDFCYKTRSYTTKNDTTRLQSREMHC